MAQFGIGQSIPRSEDPRFLRGEGSYVDDVTVAHQARGFVLRSPHAHARITAIDSSAAERSPGVIAVLTGADYAADGLGNVPCISITPPLLVGEAVRPPYPALALDRVRRVGDAVAFVVAETISQAKDAAELIEIGYEPLAAAATIEDALADGATAIWDNAPDNVAFTIQRGDETRADAAIAASLHVVRLEVSHNRLTAAPMEQRGAIGEHSRADGRYTIRASTQVPHRMRQLLAQSALGVPETAIRVIAGDVGGGFGMKGGVYPEDVLVLWAAKRTGRAVKWIAERSESFVSDTHGRDQRCVGEMGFDDDGRITGFRIRSQFNVGSHLSAGAGVPPMHSSSLMSGAYDIPAIHVVVTSVFTNTPTLGPYRGAGRPEAAFFVERMMTEAAKQLGIDEMELRRRNYIRPNAMPFKTALNYTYDSGEFEAATDVALRLSDWDGYGARRAQSESRGRLRGRGFSYYVEVAASLNERMEIRFDPSGAATVVAGTFSHGQGHETIFPQMVSGWLGIPFESIRLVQGDTDQVSFGRGTSASRSMTVGGSALKLAADEIIEKGKHIASHLLEAAESDLEFADGAYSVTGTDRAIGMVEVAKAAYAPMGAPSELRAGLEASGNFAAEPPNFPNGCHVVEVEIDPETGVVEIDRFSAVDDVGHPINPLLLHGQVHGGIAQGIGQALFEHVAFDRESGQMLSGSFMDYCMPRADDMPGFDLDDHDVPCTTNPLGVKGAGEAGTIGAPPAIVSAVLDALAPLGVSDIDMPMTPNRVWNAIEAARRNDSAG